MNDKIKNVKMKTDADLDAGRFMLDKVYREHEKECDHSCQIDEKTNKCDGGRLFKVKIIIYFVNIYKYNVLAVIL